MRYDANSLVAWASAITAFVAIVTLIVQIKIFRTTIGVNVILKLQEEFDSEKMEKLRNAASQYLKTSMESGDVEGVPTLDALLNFFEKISLLVYRNVVDRELVWHSFYYWIHRYWLIAQPYIKRVGETDPETWTDLSRLHRQLRAIENCRRRRPCDDLDAVSEKELIRFLDEEIILGNKPPS